MSSRAWLTLAAVAAAVAAAWWALRARALAPPASVADADGILADEAAGAPSSSSSPSSSPSSEPPSVVRWRAGVVRAAIQYRDAVAEAARLVAWSGWTEAQRIAGVIADAATTETRASMRFRVAFLRSAPQPPSALVADAGPEAARAVAALPGRLDALRVAVAAELRDIYDLPADLAGAVLDGGTAPPRVFSGAGPVGPDLELRR